MANSMRRLAAIMFTDMVGYTALGQRDESLSIAMAEAQQNLIRPVLARHGGREVKTMGDAFLVEFSNALEAVRCAYDVQRAVREFNLALSDEKRIHLRIGIHLGDIEERQGDILGDAVNVASRIEPLAEDGGVCLTHPVYEQVQNKFELPMVNIGLKSLKNVSEPIQVYRMEMPWARAVGKEGIPAFPTSRIAVLPFANFSIDPNDVYFADGVTDEIITTVSGISGLSVISRTSVLGYKGTTKKVKDIGKELEVGSILEGSFKKAGNRIRVTTQLIDVAQDKHLWAQNYDRDLDDIFAVQTDIAKQVAESLKVKLLEKEVERIERRTPENLSAYQEYLKGRALLASRKGADLEEAKSVFESAIALDPAYAPAYSGLADAYMLLGDYSFLPYWPSLRKTKELVLKALDLDPEFAEARATNALVMMNEAEHARDFSKAEEEFKRAIALNPSYANAHMWYGSFVLTTLGRYEEALMELGLAEKADPMSIVVLFNEALWMLTLDRIDEATARKVKMEKLYPGHWMIDEINTSILFAKGEYDKVIDLSMEYLGRDDKSPRAVVLFEVTLALAFAWIGKKDKTREWLRKIMTIPDTDTRKSGYVMSVLAALEETDEYFAWAKRSLEDKTLGHAELRFIDKWVPGGQKIRLDPRFAELFTKVGLSPELV